MAGAARDKQESQTWFSSTIRSPVQLWPWFPLGGPLTAGEVRAKNARSKASFVKYGCLAL